MRLTVLGSNGTYPTPGRPASGYLVSSGTTTVWLDAGPGTLAAVMAGRGLDVVDALVLSHVHPDHCTDVFSLLNVFRFDSRRGLPVLAPPGVADRVAGFLDADQDHDLHDVFDFVVVRPGDHLRIGGLTLDFGRAAHPVPAVVTRVSDGTRSMVYSGDTGPDGDLVALAGGADVLLCEATLQGTIPDDRYPYHLYAVEAGQAATTAGVGRLIVTHVAPTLDPGVSVREAAAAFDGPVEHATSGKEIEL